MHQDSNCALFVDLDGTLTASDLLADAIVLALKKNPLNLFRLVVWAMGGRANLKRQLGQRISHDVTHLPYRSQVIDFLAEQRTLGGHKIVLATASDELWASPVSEHLGLFDDVIASNGDVNLKGTAKLEAIRRTVGNMIFPHLTISEIPERIFRFGRLPREHLSSTRIVRRCVL